MRTTLDIDENLLLRARNVAREQGTTLTRIVEEALAALLADRHDEQKPFVLRWAPHQGKYLGGVDIADRRSLYDVMDDNP
ncbi:MAG: type II toxin-antitoxin system VapB family antitoxin [Bradymonadales bacterium]|nr:type II toxin-antitoxin system VapB family antitoxin [Bradymonadales bacterium]